MSKPFTDVESQAMNLPRADQARLANRLLASVYGDDEVDDAWAVDVERRIAAVEAGAPLIAAETAIAKARQSLA